MFSKKNKKEGRLRKDIEGGLSVYYPINRFKLEKVSSDLFARKR